MFLVPGGEGRNKLNPYIKDGQPVGRCDFPSLVLDLRIVCLWLVCVALVSA
jgi:hypothetical protein